MRKQMQVELEALTFEILKQFESTGLQIPSEINLSQDHLQNIQILSDYTIGQLINEKDMTRNNELAALSSLNLLVDMTQAMTGLSHLLYAENSRFPLQMYRDFRQIYCVVETLMKTLTEFQSSDKNFLESKKKIIEQQIEAMQTISCADFGSTESFLLAESSFGKSSLSKNEQALQESRYEEQISLLQTQVDSLKRRLRSNDQQFTQEVEKYNQILCQMNENLELYKNELSKVTHLELTVIDLQSRLVRFREEKYRNEIVIDNMARKIRYYEKNAVGVEVFKSPSRVRSR